MIGYYIHHHGSGHLSRATAIAHALDEPVTGLSSLPRPEGWPGDWIDLPLDDGAAEDDARAHGRLHWVPLGSPGLRERTAAISRWISSANPSAVVVDVSVEVVLLARLHGVPVATFALPGDRGDDAHRLGFDIAAVVLAAWPPQVENCLRGLSPAAARKLVPVGAIGTAAPSENGPPPIRPGSKRVLVLSGAGGDDFTEDAIRAAQAETPDWTWERIGGTGTWVDDVTPHLEAATLVVTHAGQGAIADVAAARRPAVVIPQSRPHEEQYAAAHALGAGEWPVIVLERFPGQGWAPLIARAATLDGDRWARWNDGRGAHRAAAVIERVARGGMR